MHGSGKTRFGLKVLQDETKRKSYMIRNLSDNTIKDLSYYFRKGNKYLVLLDDVRNLNAVANFLNFIINNFDSGDFKLMITVTDTELEEIEELFEHLSHKSLKINLFDSHELRTIIMENLKIRNNDYLSQIQLVSKGNIKLAFMLGKIALTNGNLESICNNGNIIKNFYKLPLQDIESEPNSILVLGLLSFFNLLDLRNKQLLKEISAITNLTLHQLNEYILFLKNKNIISIFDNDIVIVTDSGFAEFVFFYVFIAKKKLDLKLLISMFYKSHKREVIVAIKSILSLSYCESMILLEVIINELLNEKMAISENEAFSFCALFASITELNVIRLVQKNIKSMKNKSHIIEFSGTIDASQNKYVSYLLETMKILAKGVYFKETLDLFLLLLQKENINLKSLITVIIESYSLSSCDFENNNIRSLYVLKIFSDDENIKKPNYRLILRELIIKYLPLFYTKYIYEEKKTVNGIRYNYNLESYNYEFRKLLWEIIDKCFDNNFKKEAIEVLFYGLGVNGIEPDIIRKELTIIINSFADIIINNPEIATEIERFSNYSSLSSPVLDAILKSDNVKMFRLMFMSNYDNSKKGDYSGKKSKKDLIKFAKTFDDEKKIKMNNFLICFYNNDKKHNSIIDESLRIVLLNLNDKYFLEMLNQFLDFGYPILFNPNEIYHRVVNFYSDFLKFLSEKTFFPFVNNWKLYYYEHLDEILINEALIDEFLVFLKNYSLDDALVYRLSNGEKFLKYKDKDNFFFEKYFDIALQKNDETFKSMINSILISYYCKPNELYELLNYNTILFVNSFSRMMKINQIFDLKRHYITFIANIDDKVVYNYIDNVLSCSFADITRRFDDFSFIWKLNNNKELASYIVNQIVLKIRDGLTEIEAFNFFDLLRSEEYEQEYYFFIQETITINRNPATIHFLSSFFVGTKFEISLFEAFIKSSQDFSLFEHYSLCSPHFGGKVVNKKVPYIQERIEVLNKMLTVIPHELVYLDHRKMIESQILHYEKMEKEIVKRQILVTL